MNISVITSNVPDSVMVSTEIGTVLKPAVRAVTDWKSSKPCSDQGSVRKFCPLLSHSSAPGQRLHQRKQDRGSQNESVAGEPSATMAQQLAGHVAGDPPAKTAHHDQQHDHRSTVLR